MKVLPEGWRVHHDNDVEAERRPLKRRFEAAERRRELTIMLKRLDRWASLAALAVIGGCALYWAVVILSPWPPLVLLKHIASSPNCNAARAVGLAPAYRGDPGYWPTGVIRDTGRAIMQVTMALRASRGRVTTEGTERQDRLPFTLLPYFWSLMLRAVISEFYLPGATRGIV
jgi:hypothetical protein